MLRLPRRLPLNLFWNLPSKISPQPQEGLFSINSASKAPTDLAIARVISAPFKNCCVKSTLFMFMTLALPPKTSPRSPPTISAGTRGTPKQTYGFWANWKQLAFHEFRLQLRGEPVFALKITVDTMKVGFNEFHNSPKPTLDLIVVIVAVILTRVLPIHFAVASFLGLTVR